MGKTEEEKKKEEKAILTKLALLARMRKLHEWTVFGHSEAEEEERKEAEIDKEIAKTDQPEE